MLQGARYCPRVHGSSTRLLERLRSGGHGRARGHHVIKQSDVRALQIRLIAGARKRVFYISLSLNALQPGLGAGIADARQAGNSETQAESLRNGAPQ